MMSPTAVCSGVAPMNLASAKPTSGAIATFIMVATMDGKIFPRTLVVASTPPMHISARGSGELSQYIQCAVDRSGKLPAHPRYERSQAARDNQRVGQNPRKDFHDCLPVEAVLAQQQYGYGNDVV